MDERRRTPPRRRRRRRRKRRSPLPRLIAVLAALCALLVIGLLVRGGEEKENAPSAEPAAQTEEAAPEAEADPAQTLLEGMSLEEKIYQLFMVTPEQLIDDRVPAVTQTDEDSRQAIRERPVGGVIYFAQNLETPEQVREMIGGLQEASALPLFIGVDEEGGTVSRAGSNPAMGITAFPPMAEIGASGDPAQAYRVGYTLGAELSRLGFNLDFAPVADVFSNPENSIIGGRAFGTDGETVSAMVSSAVTGFRESGLLCSAKHFPGHGDTASDSHTGAAYTYRTLPELEAMELLPFRAAMEAGVPFIMVGHISAPNVTGTDVPSSLSYDMVQLLKSRMGYQGLVITDAMNMGAVTDRYSSGEAAVMAIQAGVDVILMPEDFREAVSGVQAAVKNGTLSVERIEESVLKILNTKLSYGMIP